MKDFWTTLCTATFMPHGHCYLWEPGLLWLHILSDALIAAAYFSIPFTLVYFVRKRRDLEFNWIFLCFALFIVACGATHLMEIWVIWHPTYWLSGSVKAVTALASVPTAWLLVKLVPRAVGVPSAAALREANLALEREIVERKRAEAEVRRVNDELERRVGERTAQLEAANKTLELEVAERRRAEIAGNESQRLLEAISDNSPAVIYAKDLDGRYLLANRRYEEIFHLARETIIGRTDKELFPVAAAEAFRAMDLRVIAAGRTLTEEETAPHHDGPHTYISVKSPLRDHAGNVYGVFGISTDITERKSSEEKLRASTKEIFDLRAALDEHAIVAITDPQGKITYVNDKFCAISKYSREELIGHDHRIINSAFHSKEFIRDLWKTIGSGQVWRGEIQNRAKDGSVYWVATTIVPFLDEHGKPRQYVAIRADITERKRAETEITRLNAELEQRVARRTAQLEEANRELEAFSYSVSHDLRAPLRGIDGFARILQEDYADKLDAEGRRVLGIIGSESKRMGQLIDDLLGFSRMSRQQLAATEIDMAGLAQSVFEGLMAAGPKHTPRLILKPLPTVSGDRATLRQVFVNLLGNAVKFTARQAEPTIEVGGQSAGGVATFYVKDNGVGFDEKYRSKLFGVFQRLHSEEEFEGTGVGLALVQRIVIRHGGKVWAEGRPGEGATFYFTLPEATEGPL